MLPQKTKYAIKALLALAKNYKEPKPLSIAFIAKEEKIPRKFLELIMLDLKRLGFVKSKMGPTGGYFLVKHPEELMLSTIIRSTGAPIALLPCASLNFYEKCKECKGEDTCGLRDVALEVRDESIKILSKTSLADIFKRENKIKRKLKSS